MINRLLTRWRRMRLAAILRETAPEDTCYIASNCIGGRLSQLSGRPYRSPTVGLWFAPDDFLRFAADLSTYLVERVRERADLAEGCGHPVGEVGDVVLWFQHYPDFAAAERDWRRRADRVDLKRVALTFTDRDGARPEHLERFELLTAPRIAFTTGAGGLHAAPVPAYRGAACVGDLYTHWTALAPVLTRERCSVWLSELRAG